VVLANAPSKVTTPCALEVPEAEPTSTLTCASGNGAIALPLSLARQVIRTSNELSVPEAGLGSFFLSRGEASSASLGSSIKAVFFLELVFANPAASSGRTASTPGRTSSKPLGQVQAKRRISVPPEAARSSTLTSYAVSSGADLFCQARA